jgi:hypothetical protein
MLFLDSPVTPGMTGNGTDKLFASLSSFACEKSALMRIKSMEILWFAAIIGVWVLLQAVVLPKLGIST